MAELTAKQEKFCQLVVQLGNATEAYKKAYNSKAKPESMKVEACKLLKEPNISLTVDKLKQELRERNRATLDDLLEELEEARELALNLGQPAAMVSATSSKAKMLGLDKQVIEHQGKIEQAVSGVQIEIINEAEN